MTLDEAIREFEFDCKVRHLSPKTIDNYRKQLRYFERFLGNEFSITSIECVKPSHIKRFLSMMDDAGRKPQYINDLLKVCKNLLQLSGIRRAYRFIPGEKDQKHEASEAEAPYFHRKEYHGYDQLLQREIIHRDKKPGNDSDDV